MDFFSVDSFLGDTALSVNVVTMTPQPNCKLHKHAFRELVFIYSGSGECYTPEGARALKPGEVYITYPGEAHGYRAVHDLVISNLVYIPANLPVPALDMGDSRLFQALVGPMAPHRQGPPHPLCTLEADALETIWQELALFANRHARLEPGNRFRCFTSFLRIIGLLTRYDLKGNMNYESWRQTISSLIDYLEFHYQEHITERQMVELTHMSTSTLLRRFHQLTKTTPLEYLIHIRIRHAIELMQNSSQSILAIALAVGFSSSSYFTRCFRTVTGATPSAYCLQERS